jgi:fructose-specific phosphotransferase system IIA component
MKLQDHTAEELCVAGLNARDRTDCIARLCDQLHRSGYIQDPGEMAEALLAREHIESTAIGGGIALPHARSAQVSSAVVAIAQLAEPIDFRAHDDAPVDLIFMLLGAHKLPGQHLRTLARVSQLLRHHGFLLSLREAASSEEMHLALKEAESELP